MWGRRHYHRDQTLDVFLGSILGLALLGVLIFYIIRAALMTPEERALSICKREHGGVRWTNPDGVVICQDGAKVTPPKK